MGVFDIWRPDPEKAKEKPKEKAAPFALPHGEAPKHFLPGPPAAKEPEKPKTVKELFSVFAPKEEKKPESQKPAKSLMDVLIPESERGGMYYGSTETYRPPEAEYTRRPAPRSSRKMYGWNMPSPEEFARRLPSMFNLDLVWDDVRSQRHLPWFEQEARNAFQTGRVPILSLVPVAPTDDPEILGYAFGVPREVMDSYLEGVPTDQEVYAVNAFWDEILWPLFEMLTPAFEIVKPDDLPGWFQLDIGQHDPGVIELQYLEAGRS